MNSYKIFSAVVVFTISPMALGSGTHGSGHGESENQSEMKNMDHSMMENMGHWMAPEAEAAKENPIKMNDESVLAGQELFATNCASCHGVNGEGDGAAGAYLKPKPANLRAMANAHPDGDFAYKIKTGRGSMPGWKSILNDAEVWHLVNYIKSLGKKPVVKQSSENGHTHAAGKGHDS